MESSLTREDQNAQDVLIVLNRLEPTWDLELKREQVGDIDLFWVYCRREDLGITGSTMVPASSLKTVSATGVAQYANLVRGRLAKQFTDFLLYGHRDEVIIEERGNHHGTDRQGPGLDSILGLGRD